MTESTSSEIKLVKDSTVPIDPDGDIVLIAGPSRDGRGLRVSSKVLTLASPVFGAMVRWQYLEAPETDDENPGVIFLKDDSLRPLTTLCNALHLQSQFVRVTTFIHLREITTLCDKYDCARAIKPWSKIWLHRWRSRDVSLEQNWWLLYISYVFDDHDAFYAASQAVLKHSDKDAMESFRDLGGLALLPDGLHEYLMETRIDIMQKVYTQLESTIHDLMRAATPDVPSGGTDKPASSNACDARCKTGTYFFELSRLGLWPLSDDFLARSFVHMTSSLSDFRDPPVTMRCDCSVCTAGLKYVATQAVHEVAETALHGLCVTCVRAQRLSGGDGNCRGEVRCRKGSTELAFLLECD